MKAYKAKLSIDDGDEATRLLNTLQLYRSCWNSVAEIAYSLKKPRLVQIHQKCYDKCRKLYPDLPSKYVIKAQQDVVAAYKSVKSNEHKIENPIELKKLVCQLDVDMYKFKDSGIQITAAGGCRKRVATKIHSYPKLAALFKTCSMRDPKLQYVDGQFWLVLVFETPTPIVVENSAVGVDLGCRRIAAVSDGRIFKGNQFTRYQRRTKYLQSRLQSVGTKSAKRHLKKLRRDRHNFTKNFNHHLCNEILKTDSNMISIENLKNIKRFKKGQRKMNDVAFQQIATMLSYKARAIGKMVVTVNPAYSSQIDHRSGENDGKRIGCRYYASDGVVLDADLNAANNIAIRSKFPVSCCKALDGQAIVNSPIVASEVNCHRIATRSHRNGVIS